MPNLPQINTAKMLAKRLLYSAAGVRKRLSPKAPDAILLTFDDGPDPDVTPAVLDLLARYGARAVFFIVGKRIPRAPHVLEIIRANGHIIGNHTHSHDANMRYAEYRDDLACCQKATYALTNVEPWLFRPPEGRLTIAGLRASRDLGLKPILYSVDGRDWTLRDSAAAVEVGKSMAHTTSAGDILLLHDDNRCVLDVLSVLLPRLAERRLDLSRGAEFLG